MIILDWIFNGARKLLSIFKDFIKVIFPKAKQIIIINLVIEMAVQFIKEKAGA